MQLPNQEYQFQRLTTSGLIKKGSGVLGGFLVAQGTPTITIYDNTTNSGTIIVNGLVVSATSTPYPVPAKFVNGCYVVITGTCDVTFFYN